jgi:AraC-like DNA-binding protein
MERVVSYNVRLLFEKISDCLHNKPGKTLAELSQRLRVSERTIERACRRLAGRSFRRFREEILLRQVTRFLELQPEIAIKELSFGVGFKSTSSFARAIKRASGLSPEQLRTQLPNSEWGSSRAVSVKIYSEGGAPVRQASTNGGN